MQLNNPERLPPVDCPLLIQMPCGRIVPAVRTSFIEHRDREMSYRLDDGRVVTGRYPWTYP